MPQTIRDDVTCVGFVNLNWGFLALAEVFISTVYMYSAIGTSKEALFRYQKYITLIAITVRIMPPNVVNRQLLHRFVHTTSLFVIHTEPKILRPTHFDECLGCWGS